MFWRLWPTQKCSFLFIFTESNFSSFYEGMIVMGLEFFLNCFLSKILQLQLQNVLVFSLLVFPFPHMTPAKLIFAFLSYG